MGQNKSALNLIKSKSLEMINLNGKDVVKVYQGTFKQDYSILQSDSAYFYVKDNVVDAFGHVHITQGDTLNIYSDKLNYNGNSKIALLTDNVRMIDKDAILTTNFLTYNTATRIGTYTGGGKLVNKDNTLTSKNGYYFAFSRDAYFRYNVVLVTPEALIKTDTLRYSTASRIAYFLGPTNIYDTKDKKDTLYTENGTYNTVTEQAFFGKKNLYKSGTKTLKGDSLFYDKLKGYGKAMRNVIFHDREQNITMKGNLANYYKAGERTVVTKDPVVIIVTEEKDTTATDTVPAIKPVIKGKDGKVIAQADVKTATAVTPAGTMPIKNMPNLPVKQAEAAIKSMPALPMKQAGEEAIKNISKIPVKQVGDVNNKNLPQLPKSMPALPVKLPGKDIAKLASGDTAKALAKDSLNKNLKKGKVKHDSIYISAIILETQIITGKEYKLMQERQRLLRIRDTTTKLNVPVSKKDIADIKKESKFLTLKHPGMRKDTNFLHRDFFTNYKPKSLIAVKPIKAKNPAAPGDTTKAAPKRKAPGYAIETDPVFITHPVVVSDTARIRIIKAYTSAKLFKSDLQAKADSMFYSYSDSTLRCYVNPIIWAQGSQLSGDTINMQMKNKKLDNMDLFPSSFIVNIEKGDSTHFNQVAGKRMKGFFKNDKLDRMFISGNAESIYFSRDSGKVSGMQRSLASRMRIIFKSNNARDIFFLTKPEHRYGPLHKFEEDERILRGFIWKPKERPISKESILPSYAAKHNPPPAKVPAGKKSGTADNTPPGTKPKMAGDSVLNKMPNMLPAKASKDSVISKLPLLKTGKDTVPPKSVPMVKPKADTTAVKKQ
jgi:lipopolysaccharide export system protein LptA